MKAITFTLGLAMATLNTTAWQTVEDNFRLGYQLYTGLTRAVQYGSAGSELGTFSDRNELRISYSAHVLAELDVSYHLAIYGAFGYANLGERKGFGTPSLLFDKKDAVNYVRHYFEIPAGIKWYPYQWRGFYLKAGASYLRLAGANSRVVRVENGTKSRTSTPGGIGFNDGLGLELAMGWKQMHWRFEQDWYIEPKLHYVATGIGPADQQKFPLTFGVSGGVTF